MAVAPPVRVNDSLGKTAQQLEEPVDLRRIEMSLEFRPSERRLQLREKAFCNDEFELTLKPLSEEEAPALPYAQAARRSGH